MSNYLVTGCSRGFGLGLVEELVRLGPSVARLIFATSRGDQVPAKLQEVINKSDGRVRHVPLDVADHDSIVTACNTVQKALSDSRFELDVLINNAGITVFEPGRTSAMKGEDMARIFETNVIAVHNVTQAFLPLLRRGKEKKIVNISSTLGSIKMVKMEPGYDQIPTTSYMISKAALNMLTVQYATDLKGEGFTVVAISPGNMQTELGGKDAPLTVETGASATLEIVRSSTFADSGRFRNIHVPGDKIHDGVDPPW